MKKSKHKNVFFLKFNPHNIVLYLYMHMYINIGKW